VPATHEEVAKLPAVSGSSGRLVVEQVAEPSPERHWPGQVFADESRDYPEAMLDFVAASNRKPPSVDTTDGADRAALKAQKRALRREAAALQDGRRQERQRRQLEDAAWKALKRQRQAQSNLASQTLLPARKAQEAHWRMVRRQRHQLLAERNEVDREWRQQRLVLRQQWSQFPIVTAWIAILVMTDNCTRQCLGLPLFVAGPKVTAEMIVEALTVLLPPDLLFLISDRGIHFRADAFRTLTHNQEFIHVLIARHRPGDPLGANGIAERFVRSLKEWLRDKSWHDDLDLARRLDQFLADYNDRPHQGLPIPGLSPNEFAGRIWLF
jgi:hypothetical protein